MKCLLILSVAMAGCRAAEVGLLYAAFNGIESGGWIEPENAPVAITAELIKEMTSVTPVKVGDMVDNVKTWFKEHEYVIAGIPTLWGHKDSRRSASDWDVFMYFILGCDKETPRINLSGNKIALYGLSDMKAHTANFQDAMGELAACFEKAGASLYGRWSTLGYDFEASRSIWVGAETPGAGGISIAVTTDPRGDDPWEAGMFVGLALDEVIQEEKAPLTELTKQRVAIWLSQLEAEGFPLSVGVCERRRLQSAANAGPAAAPVDENEWYAEWYARLVCWLGAQPLDLRQRLRECPAAMTAQLKAYVEAEAPAALPTPPLGAEHWLDVEPGCEWVHEQKALQSGFLPALPELPQLPQFRFSLPRMPANLLPWGLKKWNELGGGARSSSKTDAVEPRADGTLVDSTLAALAQPAGAAAARADAAQAVGDDAQAVEDEVVVELVLSAAAGMAGALVTGLVAVFLFRSRSGSRPLSVGRRRAAPVSVATLGARTPPCGGKPPPIPGSATSVASDASIGGNSGAQLMSA